jgi:hypothetical protein
VVLTDKVKQQIEAAFDFPTPHEIAITADLGEAVSKLRLFADAEKACDLFAFAATGFSATYAWYRGQAFERIYDMLAPKFQWTSWLKDERFSESDVSRCRRLFKKCPKPELLMGMSANKAHELYVKKKVTQAEKAERKAKKEAKENAEREEKQESQWATYHPPERKDGATAGAPVPAAEVSAAAPAVEPQPIPQLTPLQKLTRMADDLEAFAEEAPNLNKKGDEDLVMQKKRITKAIAQIHVYI